MDFYGYVQTLKRRLDFVESLFNKDKLCISLDKLNSEKEVNHEILYFKDAQNEEQTGLFVFGFKYFLKELGEQEFKRILGQNSLNFKIYSAYSRLKKTKRKIKVTDILNEIQSGKKDSLDTHKYLRRILTLSYYLNWELEKDKKDLEGDSFVKIPNNYLMKLTQRFNFDIVGSVYENDDVFIFLNARNKLNLVFKNKETFKKSDIKKCIIPIVKKVFKIKNVILE